MALRVCIPELVANGAIPEDRAAGITARYERMVAELEPGMGRAAAEALATEKSIRWLERDALQRKVDSLRQMKAQQSWLDTMKIKAEAASPGGPLQAGHARDALVRIDKQMDAVRGQYFASLDGLLARHRRDVLGRLRHKAELEPIGRAMLGEKVDDLNANEMAQALSGAMELARQRRNAAGGHIGKIDNYLPQRQDERLVGAVSYDEWRSFGPVERVKVMDHETGDWLTGLARETRLREINESIVSESANRMQPGQMGTGALAGRRGDPRSLHFDNYDDWMEYQQRFGGGDSVYDIVVGHLGGMARETALMEAMGPNPAATLRFQQDWLAKSAKLSRDQKLKDRLPGAQRSLQHLFDELTGANKIPDNRALALGFSAFRALQVAAKLGSALLSVAPDFATLLKTAHFNDVPMMKVLGRYVTLWNPRDDGDRRLAVRLGLVTDDWLGLTSASHRYTGEELTGEVSRRLADFVIRGQGLARHTRNGQWAFGMEFLSHLTQMKDHAFDALDPALQRAMRRYDIGRADWDAYRATAPSIERGSDWIFPADVKGKSGGKLLEMVLSETDYGVIVPDVRTRAFLGRARPGTWTGEVLKSAALFKSFPLAIYNLHGRRMLEQPGVSNKAVYGLTLAGMMLAGGALSAQLKTVASGKDPVPMDDRRFLARAAAQAGALGLFGDLLYNSENSYGGGLLATAAGPVLGDLLPNALDATLGNAKRALDGDDATKAHVARDVSKVALREMPLGNLWWDRLALELTFKRMIREWADPDIAAADQRMMRRAAQEGTQYYAPPGAGPGDLRAPDFGNAIGQPSAPENVARREAEAAGM